mgnify:FL=1
MKLHKGLISLALLLAPSLALAHPGHASSGLLAGLSHPLLGLDHLLAMLAVGLWAAQQQGSARWALPLTFVGSLLLGGLLGLNGLGFAGVESAIAASLLALGVLVAVAARLPLGLAMGLTALFAVNHGIAHGMEVPALSSAWAYVVGFCLATVALHAAGYTALKALPSRLAASLSRVAGSAFAGTGLYLLS